MRKNILRIATITDKTIGIYSILLMICNIIITQHHNIMSIFSPAFCNTTCASIDLLMFDEHTVPNDNFDGWRSASGGGIPGGVDERCRPGTFMAKV